MARLSLFMLFIFLAGKTYTQPTVTEKFDHLYIGENFDSINSYWTTLSNVDNLLIVQEGEYIMHRKAAFSPYAILARFEAELTNYRLVTSLKLDKTSSDEGSIGILFTAQPEGTGGFILELNKKQQLRLRQIIGNAYKLITSTGDGWISNSAIKEIGLPNLVELRTANSKYDLFINNTFILSFVEPAYKSGSIGFLIGPASKGKADFIYIFTPSGDAIADNTNQPVPATPETDIIALAESIISLKTHINKLEEENTDLKGMIETIKSGEKEWEIKQSTFEKEIKKLRAQIKASTVSFDSLMKVNSELQKYKDMVKGNDNGDIVINLSRSLKNEKLANETLKTSNKALQDSILVLKTMLKNQAGDNSIKKDSKKTNPQPDLQDSNTEFILPGENRHE